MTLLDNGVISLIYGHHLTEVTALSQMSIVKGFGVFHTIAKDRVGCRAVARALCLSIEAPAWAMKCSKMAR